MGIGNIMAANNKRQALGRGLDSLIRMDEVRTDGSTAISEIEISRIVPNPEQPRRTFDDESLDELAVSIRELGVVQPLTLRQADDGNYQIIAGERRWRAASRAGLLTVPAYIRVASDSEMTEMALIENIQREDLNSIEVALGFKQLIEKYSLTQERLSERLGKKRATIANHLRLLKLPAEIQLGLRDRDIDMGHARAILAVSDPKEQLRLYKKTLKEGLSVRAVESLAREAADKSGEPRKWKRSPISPEYTAFANNRSQRFATPVKFSRNEKGRGTITFRFGSDDELHELIKRFDSMK